MGTYSFGGKTFSSLEDLQKNWDDAAYLARYKDVADAFGGKTPGTQDYAWANAEGMPGLTHFLRYGASEGRSPFFLEQPSAAAPTASATASPARDALMAQQFDNGLLSVVSRNGGDTLLSPNAASQGVARWQMNPNQNAGTNDPSQAKPTLGLLDAVNNYYTNLNTSRGQGMTFNGDGATPSYTLGSLREYLPSSGAGDPVAQNYWVGNDFVMPDASAPVWHAVDGIKWTAPETPTASNDPKMANTATAGTVASATGGIVPAAISSAVSSAISNGISNGSITAPASTGLTWGEIGDAGGTGLGLLSGVMGLGTVGKGIGTIADIAAANSQMSAQGLQGLGAGAFASAMLPSWLGGQTVAQSMANSVYNQGYAGSYGVGGLMSASPIGANGASPLPANGFVAATSPNIGTPNPPVTIYSPNFMPSISGFVTPAPLLPSSAYNVSGLAAAMSQPVSAPVVSSGGGGMFSHPDFKTDKREAEEVLSKLDGIKVERWRYKNGVADGGEHIGPYADQWAKAFGGDGVSISYQDAVGVALKAVQELSQRLSSLERRIPQHHDERSSHPTQTPSAVMA